LEITLVRGRKILDINMKPGGFGRYLAGEELGKI